MVQRKITLNDGRQMPSVAFGTGSFGHLWENDKATQDGALALRAGFRHLDTAQMYETEEAAAASIEIARVGKGEIWVTTKLSSNKVKETTPEAIRTAVEESIQKLGFKPDLFLIHNPFVIEAGKLGEAWQILEGLVDDGTLGGVSLGVSNFRPQDLEEIVKVAKIIPVLNQMEYHPYVLAQLDLLQPLHQKHNILFQAYGPLVPLIRHPDGGPIKPILERIARRLTDETGKEVDATTALLLWNLSTGVPIVTTSGNPDRIKKLAELDGLPNLTKEEVEEINQAGRSIHYRYYVEHFKDDFAVPDLPSAPNTRKEDVKKWWNVEF